MADRKVDFLLIGGGCASVRCASELRRQGAEGSILLVGREADPPYERPPLSKEYLRGESSREDALMQSEDWYEENNVELVTSKNVMGLDLEARVAKLHGKEELRFDKALLATGANVNILRVDGAQLDGVHYLRAFGNADTIREDVEDAERIVLIGGSYIACEVAASLTEMGKQCTLLMQEEVALSRSFGGRVGRYFHHLLESKGVELIGGDELGSFEGEDRVEKVVSAAGKELDCDAVVIGAGVKPDVMLAKRAGLEVDDGIICDSGLETSEQGIFAAGDCCSYDSEIHGRRLRVEHWDVAFQQGAHVARAMLGEKEPYRVVPYFFSDLSDWAAIEYVGPAADWDDVIVRGELQSGGFSAWYVKDSRVVGTLSVGRSEDLQVARKLVKAGEKIDDVAVLGQTDQDLDALIE